MDINSSEVELLDAGAFCARVRTLCSRTRAVPLLVLRMPEFSEVAWLHGKRSAHELERVTVASIRRAASRLLRSGDVLVHASGSDWFGVAMLAPVRDASTVLSGAARSVLERIAAAITVATGRRVETGWYTLDGAAQLDHLDETVAYALERGARERERHEFVSTVGHELRTPLTSIRGYVETLLDQELDYETRRRFLETVRGEALRLSNLVDGMLDVSLLEAPGSTHACDAAERAAAVCELLAPVAAERGTVLKLAEAAGARLRMSADAFTHVLINLVENAIKHGRPGGRVVLRVRRTGRGVEIRCDDDGPGVPPGLRARIFDRGVRGSNAVPGSGIGLALVKALVERCGGTVALERSPLGGAAFVLRLHDAQ